MEQEFEIQGGNLIKAGGISIHVKTILKTLGFPSPIIRRTAICCYEAEMNVVMYAEHGTLRLAVEPGRIEVYVEDKGQGIGDIEKAMQEGYSTATHEQRELGFGAGMGLPNIARNSSEMKIISQVGKGTLLRFAINVNEGDK
ncbi:MAG TPA: ATP-binding protein [Acidobacteriota bacterium]|nr:ATP-binding protein [Acidobacteriota bacterium]